MSASSINHSLNTIRTELDFLRESNVINGQTYQLITSSIPERYQAPVKNLSTTNTNSTNMSNTFRTSTNLEYVEAIYRFEPQQEGDLALAPGDKVQVLEKISPEWYKGGCNGSVGVFPSNYVKPAFSGYNNDNRSGLIPPKYQQQNSNSQLSFQSNQYQQAPPPQQQQPPFPPPSAYYEQQPLQHIVQEAPQQQQPQQKQQVDASRLAKKFGSKLGNAAIFGAGATIGSDLVNSIF